MQGRVIDRGPTIVNNDDRCLSESSIMFYRLIVNERSIWPAGCSITSMPQATAQQSGVACSAGILS